MRKQFDLEATFGSHVKPSEKSYKEAQNMNKIKMGYLKIFVKNFHLTCK